MSRTFYSSAEGAFVIGMLAPQLEDVEWLLAGKRTLAKLHGNVLLGVQLDRTIVGPTSAIVTVFIRPLYWPAVPGAFGISADLGRWPGRGSLYELSPEKRGSETAAREIAAALNEDISPLFEKLTDESAILNYPLRHPGHVLLGWGRCVSSADVRGPAAYMAAWSGKRLQAEFLLRQELRASSREDSPYEQQYAVQTRKTIELLGKRQQLLAHLEGIAERNRKEWKVDRAHSLPSLIEKAQLSGQWPLEPARL